MNHDISTKEFESILRLLRYVPSEDRAETGAVINKIKQVLFPSEVTRIYYSFSMLEKSMRSSEAVKNGYHIHSDDNALALQIGWECPETNESWKIRLSDLKRTLSASTGAGVELRRSMMGTNSRKEWANSLSEAD